ncbi:CREB-regulated transcription coactivator 3-like isoform X3 [Danaus plexippus]|uniref:CREB-regulated transcription coactivator 3-like isoform X3 n=1 Tax=Danaus plexippus TaxID=13037 RepID=UPI002AB3087B|nr:CREB-regulated transcription coactivator 3-like isoform X3 [Danaus plexippus]
MANPRKFSEKIALHNQKQAEETAAFEKIMREVSDATNKVNSSNRRSKMKAPPEPEIVEQIVTTQSLGTYRSGSLPNVAAPEPPPSLETTKPEETTLATQYVLGRSGGASPTPRSPGRGRASSSVGPMRRPADRKHDTSPYGSTVYLSPPPDSNWRRTNSDSALHQSCGEQQTAAPPLSPHHPLHSHAHPHLHPHQNHRRAGNINLDVLATLGMSPNNRPRSSCEIPRIPNNNNVYESGVDASGALSCGELSVPGGSLPDLTSVHYPPPHYLTRASPDYQPRYSPTSPGAVSPGGGSVSPATGGLSPQSGSPVGATVPLATMHEHPIYETQSHLSVPNTNNYLHHNKNMSPLNHSWMTSNYQSHCSPPSQYSSTSNINIPSPTMVHSPGSPGESPQTDYTNLHQALLQPFEQITMQGVDWAQLVQSLVESGWTAHVHVPDNLDAPTSNYNTTYINHSSHSQQTTNSTHTYTQSSQPCHSGHSSPSVEPRRARDPVAGGAYPLQPLQPLASPQQPPTPATPASIPDIILTDYSGELDPGIFGGEEAQLRAGLDLDDLTLLEEPSSLLPDSSVEHEFRLDRLDRL